MVRWDPEGMRTLSHDLVGWGSELAGSATEVRLALAVLNRYHGAPAVLTSLDRWTKDEAAELTRRADDLDAADRTLHLRLGALAIDVALPGVWLDGATAERIALLEAQLATRHSQGVSADHVAAIAGELREMRRRRLVEVSVLLTVEPGADLRGELERLADSLGFGTAEVIAAVRAVEEGLSPAEAGLDPLLFPPGYVADHERRVGPILDELTALEERLAERRRVLLEMQLRIDEGEPFTDVVMEFGMWPVDVELELHELFIESRRIERRLEDARKDVAVDAVSAIERFLALPLPPELLADAAGQVLAEVILDDGGAVDEVVVVIAAHPSPELAVALFERLGPSASSVVPSRIVEEADDEPGTATELLRVYSEALGRASRHGLSWSGGQLVRPDDMPFWTQDPGELFRYGVFASEFIADAGVVLVELYGTYYAPLLGPSPGVFSDPYSGDPRLLVLERIGESVSASVNLLDRLGERGMIELLLMPETPYLDDGRAVGLLLAELADTDRAIGSVIATIAQSEAELQPGVAIGAVAVLDGNMRLLVPTGSEWDSSGGAYTGVRLNDYDIDRRVGHLVTEAEIDGFLEAILRDPLAAQALLQGAGVYVTAELEGAPPKDLQERVDELGALIGRIVRIRTDVAIEEGQASDREAAIFGQIVSVLGGVAVGVATAGVGSLALALLAGAVGDVVVDQTYGHLVPIDGETEALREAMSSDEFALEFWRYLVVGAVWDTDSSFFGEHPPPHAPDGTMLNLWGPTITEDLCVDHDPGARAEWYRWLNSLPDDMQLALDAIADTAHSRFAEESRLRE